MTTLCIEELDRRRQDEMELWMKARREMNRIIAERANHPESWVEEQIASFRQPEMLRRMLAVSNFGTV